MKHNDIERLIDAAEHHGADSGDPDHEVGDLQDILRSCWETMTPHARANVLLAHADLLEDHRLSIASAARDAVGQALARPRRARP